MQPAYDCIIIGGGHNGLTCAAYLAMGGEKDGRNKLKVLVLERYHKVGGAAMSEEIYPGFTYSTCSYVCSLLRPEIFRFLDLPRHGLQVMPYEINGFPNPDGEGIVTYSDHDRTRESLRRHSDHDAETYDYYAAEIMRQCRFIRPLMSVTPPDPTRLNPFAQNRINPWGRHNDLEGLLKIGREFGRMGEKQMYEIIRFWAMSIGDFLDEYFENARWKGFSATSSIIGTALAPSFARHGLCAAASLYGRGGRADRRLGLRPRRHGLGQHGHGLGGARSRRRDPHRRRSEPHHHARRPGRRRGAREWRGDLCPHRRHQCRSQAHLSEADRTLGPRCHRSRHPQLCQELQDPRLLRQAEHRARTACRTSPGCRRKRAGAPSISAAISITSSTPSTITNTAAGRSGRSSIA